MNDIIVKANKHQFIIIMNTIRYGEIKPIMKSVHEIEEIIRFLSNTRIKYEVVL